MERLTVDVKTKVLNDLDEKVCKMAEIIIEKPSRQKVIYRLSNGIIQFIILMSTLSLYYLFS